MSDRDSLIHTKKPFAKQSSAELELQPPRGDRWRADRAPTKRDVRRWRSAVPLLLVHGWEATSESVQKVGPIHEVIGRAVQHRSRYRHRVWIAPKCLENLRAPVGADDAVILGERHDLTTCPLDRARAKLEHRRSWDADPRQPIRGGGS